MQIRVLITTSRANATRQLNQRISESGNGRVTVRRHLRYMAHIGKRQRLGEPQCHIVTTTNPRWTLARLQRSPNFGPYDALAVQLIRPSEKIRATLAPM